MKIARNWLKLYKNGLNETIQRKNTRVPAKISGIYIVENIQIPIVIVECGFLSNYEELKLLKTEEYQEKLARGIFNGILEYLQTI